MIKENIYFINFSYFLFSLHKTMNENLHKNRFVFNINCCDIFFINFD